MPACSVHVHGRGLIGAEQTKGHQEHVHQAGVIEMGGRGIENTEHMVTEVAIRAFYRYYREVMGF